MPIPAQKLTGARPTPTQLPRMTLTRGHSRFDTSIQSCTIGEYEVDIDVLLNSESPSTVASFIYYRVPEMESVAPSACPNTGSTLVTISGRYLTGGYNDSRVCRSLRFPQGNPTQMYSLVRENAPWLIPLHIYWQIHASKPDQS